MEMWEALAELVLQGQLIEVVAGAEALEVLPKVMVRLVALV